MSRAVGIDLGTTNSVVSVLEGGDPVVITNVPLCRSTGLSARCQGSVSFYGHSNAAECRSLEEAWEISRGASMTYLQISFPR